MSLLIFPRIPENTAEGLSDAISLSYLLPKSKITPTYQGGFRSSLSDIKRFSFNQLLGYIYWAVYDISYIYIVRFPQELATDRVLVDGFGDRYLGYVPKSVSKTTVLELCLLAKQIASNYELGHKLQPDENNIRRSIPEIDISDEDLGHIVSVHRAVCTPVADLLKKRETALRDDFNKKQTVILRDF